MSASSESTNKKLAHPNYASSLSSVIKAKLLEICASDSVTFDIIVNIIELVKMFDIEDKIIFWQ